MGVGRSKLPAKSSDRRVRAFLEKAAALTPGDPSKLARLLFAMDANASREATWDRACHLQAEMFTEASRLGGLRVQLCYYSGFMEFMTTPWVTDARQLAERMAGVRCAGGMTQIARVLQHAFRESGEKKVNALVFVGDCVEEDIDHLGHLAGKLALTGTRVFAFQEGDDVLAQRAFREIARLTGGAHCRFDASSGQQLRDLLKAAAIFAAGGTRALE